MWLKLFAYLLLYCSIPSAAHILPSFLKQQGIRNNGGPAKLRNQKQLKHGIGMPCVSLNTEIDFQQVESSIREESRVYLTSSRLFGKLHLTSDISNEDVRREICFTFRGPMQNDPNFSLVYLQGAGRGGNMSNCAITKFIFQWTPQQVSWISGLA